jgi:hypothetical protein
MCEADGDIVIASGFTGLFRVRPLPNGVGAANAAVAAASPELLAACEDLIHLNEHGDPDGRSERIRRARDVIAKARGEA